MSISNNGVLTTIYYVSFLLKSEWHSKTLCKMHMFYMLLWLEVVPPLRWLNTSPSLLRMWVQDRYSEKQDDGNIWINMIIYVNIICVDIMLNILLYYYIILVSNISTTWFAFDIAGELHDAPFIGQRYIFAIESKLFWCPVNPRYSAINRTAKRLLMPWWRSLPWCWHIVSTASTFHKEGFQLASV